MNGPMSTHSVQIVLIGVIGLLSHIPICLLVQMPFEKNYNPPKWLVGVAVFLLKCGYPEQRNEQ